MTRFLSFISGSHLVEELSSSPSGFDPLLNFSTYSLHLLHERTILILNSKKHIHVCQKDGQFYEFPLLCAGMFLRYSLFSWTSIRFIWLQILPFNAVFTSRPLSSVPRVV